MRLKVVSKLTRWPLPPRFAGRLTKTCPETTQEMGGIRKAVRKSNLCYRSSGDIGSRQLKICCVQPPIPDDARDATISCKRAIEMRPGDVEAPENKLRTKVMIADVAVNEVQHPLPQGCAQGPQIPCIIGPLPSQRRREYRYQRLLHGGGFVVQRLTPQIT